MAVLRSIVELIAMDSSNVIETRVGVTVEAESIVGAIVSTTTFAEVRLSLVMVISVPVVRFNVIENSMLSFASESSTVVFA